MIFIPYDLYRVPMYIPLILMSIHRRTGTRDVCKINEMTMYASDFNFSIKRNICYTEYSHLISNKS